MIGRGRVGAADAPLELQALPMLSSDCSPNSCYERSVILRALCEAAGRQGKSVAGLTLGDYQRASHETPLPSHAQIRRAFGSFANARASVLLAVSVTAAAAERDDGRTVHALPPTRTRTSHRSSCGRG